MKNILNKNLNESIDILDERGNIEYKVSKNETGLIAKLTNQLYKYERFFNEDLKDILMKYFDIDGDCMSYNLTRCKEAFNLGTMSFDDFVEFDEDFIDDIVKYIKDNI